jgi:hypothetical protein
VLSFLFICFLADKCYLIFFHLSLIILFQNPHVKDQNPIVDFEKKNDKRILCSISLSGHPKLLLGLLCIESSKCIYVVGTSDLMWAIDPLAQWREGVGIGTNMDYGSWSLNLLERKVSWEKLVNVVGYGFWFCDV